MAYQMNMLTLSSESGYPSFFGSTFTGDLPGGACGLISFWLKFPCDKTATVFKLEAPSGTPNNYWFGAFEVDNEPSDGSNPGLNINVSFGGSGGLSSSIEYSDTSGQLTGLHHFAISFDATTAVGQLYIDGKIPGGLLNTTFDGSVTASTDGLEGAPYPFAKSCYCIGDLYIDVGSEFFDLSVAANLAKFIDNGKPVYLGSDGSLPTGTQPLFLLTITDSGDPAGFYANAGIAGAWTAATAFDAPALCGAGCPDNCDTPSVAVADLVFSSESAPLDLNAQQNRVKFVSPAGAAAYLGTNGSLPFGAEPPVFLTVPPSGTASDFASNHGAGGVFVLNTGSLTAGSSSPAGSTYTEVIDQSANTPQGADPQIMLDWSDDGSRTWSQRVRWRSMGKIGEYLTRLRWLKCGMFRQRVLRLQVTDPVRRNLIGFYVDVEKGME